jgi:hypothetical protein
LLGRKIERNCIRGLKKVTQAFSLRITGKPQKRKTVIMLFVGATFMVARKLYNQFVDKKLNFSDTSPLNIYPRSGDKVHHHTGFLTLTLT